MGKKKPRGYTAKFVGCRCLLVSVSGGIILGTDDETATLFGSSVDGFDDIDELLFIFEDPVEFVVVSGTEIAHHVFISEEEHDGARVVEFWEGQAS